MMGSEDDLMGREIKFRAWVKSETGGTWYMSYPRWIDLEGKRICTESGLQPSEFELMQFTGLRDKNCKEIYEGDIVVINSQRFHIRFETGSFMLVRCSGETDMYARFKDCWNDDVYPISQYCWNDDVKEDTIYSLEVIGNIYENPGLLEVAQ